MKTHTYRDILLWTGRHARLGLVVYVEKDNTNKRMGNEEDLIHLFLVDRKKWSSVKRGDARAHMEACSDLEHKRARNSYIWFLEDQEAREVAQGKIKSEAAKRMARASKKVNPTAQYDDKRFNDIIEHQNATVGDSNTGGHQSTGGIADSEGDNYDYTAIK